MDQGQEKDRYYNKYTGLMRRISVTFTLQCATTKRHVVEMHSIACHAGGETINISFNSICPYNSKCTRDDDRKMIKERSTIINRASVEASVLPSNGGWAEVKRDHDEAYCTQCGETPQIVDFTSTRPRYEPLVPACDPLMQSCNYIMYRPVITNDPQKQHGLLNSFLNQAYAFAENSWLSQAIGDIGSYLDDHCGWGNFFRSYDSTLYGIDSYNPGTTTTYPSIREPLALLGGIEGYYTNLDATFNAIIAGACVGAAVVIAVIVLVVMRIRKAKKVNVVARTSDNVQMKQYVM